MRRVANRYKCGSRGIHASILAGPCGRRSRSGAKERSRREGPGTRDQVWLRAGVEWGDLRDANGGARQREAANEPE